MESWAVSEGAEVHNLDAAQVFLEVLETYGVSIHHFRLMTAATKILIHHFRSIFPYETGLSRTASCAMAIEPVAY
jgi:hypothetical protein